MRAFSRLSPTLVLVFILAIAPAASALNPSRTYKQRPEKYNLKYTEAKVPTNDGMATLVVWSFPAKGEKPLSPVLIVHSGEGNMADYLRRVDGLTSAGHPVIAFDYRGYGESSEFDIDNNMYIYPHFQDDVETMFDYVRKTHRETFDVYGWGMGAGLALGIGWSRPETRRIVADTPFLSMEDLERRFSDWDQPMEVPFAGYEKRFEPASALDGLPGTHLEKVTLIIGSNDRLMKVDDMRALAKKRPKVVDKDVFVVENPDRKDNFQVDKAAYLARLTKGLSKNK